MLKRLLFLNLLLTLSKNSLAISIPAPTIPHFENNIAGCLVSESINGKTVVRYGIIAENPSTETTKYGVADGKGHIKIPYKYDKANCLSDGKIAVKKGEKWGAVDTDDNPLLPFEYDDITDTPQSYIVKQGDKLGVLDLQGKTVLPLVYGNIRYNFSQDYRYYFVRDFESTKEGLFDFAGKQVLPFDYDTIDAIKKDKFIVVRDRKFQLIDNNGKVLIENDYKFLKYLSPNFVIAIDKNNRYGLYTTEGQMLIEPQYRNIQNVSVNDTQRLAVQQFSPNSDEYEKWKLVDLHNTSLTDFIYYDILPFNEIDTPQGKLNLANVSVVDENTQWLKWGVIDIQGRQRIKPKYGSNRWLNGYGISLDFTEGKCHIKWVGDEKSVPCKFKSIK